MKTKTVSFIMLGIAAALIALDVYLALDVIEGNTISQVIWHTSKKSPLLPFLAGLLSGHLFWRN